MDYSVDVICEYQKARSVFLKWSLLFSGVLTAAIVGNVLLVMLAGEYYTVNLVISIIVTILFMWFAIYFFSNIYGDVNSRYRYFKGYESGIKPIEEVEFLKKSDELCYINGLYVYPVYVRYAIGLNRIDKVIFAFNNDINFEMGDLLTITTYQRILLKAEKHS
ncbi:MAG: hypothetical protein J6T25_01015 [Bacilli bacterium]|nr:hypothetical protein [Bacilli bacterium]